MNRGAVACAALLGGWLAPSGCVERVQVDADALAGLVAIAVSPDDRTVSLVLPGSPEVIAYRATGRFSDGQQRDITDDVAWTTDNPFPGAFATGGTYTTSNTAAGHVTVRASHRDISATATLTVAIHAVVIDDAFPPPAPVADLFAAGTPAMADPSSAAFWLPAQEVTAVAASPVWARAARSP